METQEKIRIIKESFETLRARRIVKTQGDFADWEEFDRLIIQGNLDNYVTKTAKNKSLVTYSRLLSNLYTDSLFREEKRICYKVSNYPSSSKYWRINSSTTCPTLTFLFLISSIILLVSGETLMEIWHLFFSWTAGFLPHPGLDPPLVSILSISIPPW